MSEKKQEPTISNGGVTAADIEAWKQRHGQVKEVFVTQDGVKRIGYFRRPDMPTITAVNKLAKTDEIKSNEVMFDNCWLGGDPMLKSDGILKMTATGQLATMFQDYEAGIKNS